MHVLFEELLVNLIVLCLKNSSIMKTVKNTIIRISQCNDCLFPLPLRIARRGEVVATWECCSCGARYQGVIAEDSPQKLRRNVRRISRR